MKPFGYGRLENFKYLTRPLLCGSRLRNNRE
jgi:hypothetical protein